MKVFIYFNLHKKVWSVKALEGENKGRVIAHTTYIVIKNAKFKVSEAGRQRVLREKKKNVHAGVVGESASLFQSLDFPVAEYDRVTYNPYKYASFVKKHNEEPIHNSDWVILDGRDVYAFPNS